MWPVTAIRSIKRINIKCVTMNNGWLSGALGINKNNGVFMRKIVLIFLLLTTVPINIIMASVFCHSDDEYKRLTNIPSLFIETFDNDEITSKTDYKLCRIVIVDDYVQKYDSVKIRGRGNTSWSFEKRSFRLKFPRKVKLLGNKYANAKNWNLISNGGEKLLIRNALANFVSELCNMPFTPGTKFVDLYLNDQYWGNYQITDFIEIKKKRVDIAEQDTIVTDLNKDITGGYLLEVDGNNDPGKNYFQTSTFNTRIRIHSPELDIINERQQAYIKEYIEEFEKLLNSGDRYNTESGYYNYVDSASLMGWYLTNEICANTDLFWQIYFYKKRQDEKLYFGPVWDFDLAFNDDTRRGDNGDVTCYLMQDVEFESHYFYKWFNVIKEDERWINAQYEVYKKLYIDRNLDSLMISYVDSLIDYIRPSIEENYKRWPIWKQTHLEYKLYYSYDEYLADLKTFIKMRNAYLYSEFARKAGIDVTNDIRDLLYTSQSFDVYYNNDNKYIGLTSKTPTDRNINAAIYNTQGFIVGYFNSKNGFNASNLPKGLYILRCSIGENTKVSKIFVK